MSTGKGYVEKETSLASLEGEGGTFQSLLCLPLKSGGFVGTFECTGKGYVERELLLLRSREKGALFRPFCSPLKSGAFLWHFWVHQ